LGNAPRVLAITHNILNLDAYLDANPCIRAVALALQYDLGIKPTEKEKKKLKANAKSVFMNI
jgi:hypothetical protein